jgi:tRNA uridine 5-carboxymethylaminomethyl modification enzyme
LAQLLRRPEISYGQLCGIAGHCPVKDNTIQEAIEISIKYEGYIKRQLQHIEKFKKLEQKTIPENFSYEEIRGFSKEVSEKLSKVKPCSVGQASRISGVTPAAISLLLVSLERKNRSKQTSRVL